MTKRQITPIIQTSHSLCDLTKNNFKSQIVKRKRNIDNSTEKIHSPKSKKIKRNSNSNSNNNNTNNDESRQQVDEIIITKQSQNNIIDKSNISSSSNSDQYCENRHDWNHLDYILQFHKIEKSIAQTLVQLFNNDNTIPFIARYRKNQTNGMDADQLRIIKESYDKVNIIKKKADTVIKAIDKVGKLTQNLNNTIKSIMTLDQLDHIHSLYKVEPSKTLAQKARDIGLEPIAQAIIQGHKIPHLQTLIKTNIQGLQDENHVKNSLINIITDIITKDQRTYHTIHELNDKIYMQVQTKQNNTKKSSDNHIKNKSNDNKYSMYYDWSSSEKYIKPHHVLAINRAEAQKIITVQIIIPNNFQTILIKNILLHYESVINVSSFHRSLIINSLHIAYKKSLKPAIIRRVRRQMNEKAQEASIQVFAMNVKQLLLTQPVRGKIIIGIDPGFINGCKLAVISKQGDVLETHTIYPHKNNHKLSQSAAYTLVSLVQKYQCNLLALGNGSACRETEQFLSKLIESGKFGHHQVVYTIVDEAGASIYSCSDEAKLEFPNMDCNLISTVSIARRLQDPLAELVKIDPKHLGVGMYQHDLPPKRLMSKLNQIVTEVVSFVGVDINTASQSLLRRIAGLSQSKATDIIQWKQKNGSFINREQLRKVPGIGVKTFEQCAGFIRIIPETISSKSTAKSKSTVNENINYLDQTWIHPESYQVTKAFVDACKVNLKDLGSMEFICTVKNFANQDHQVLAKKLKTNVATLDMIIGGLTITKDQDIRGQNNVSLFRKNFKTIDDLVVGSILSGEVRNVTQFGVFVDVGVKKNGLIHIKSLSGEMLQIGQRIQVKVDSIDRERDRIGLMFISSYNL